ncbi:MAG: hypothetical protein ABEJ60_03495 [Halodesulfurarchaeum sp.]
MASIESFPTKRGTARFTEEALHFDESVVGYIRSLTHEYWQGNTRWHTGVFVGYAFALLFGLGWTISTIRSGAVLHLAVVVGLLAGLWSVDYARGFRSPERIRLDAIEGVSATRGTKGLTRPRLVVTYTDGESTRKRRVNFPSLYTSDGETAYERARSAFAERGFDTTPASGN